MSSYCEDCGECNQDNETFMGFRHKSSWSLTTVVYVLIIAALALYLIKLIGMKEIHPLVSKAVDLRNMLLVIAGIIMIVK